MTVRSEIVLSVASLLFAAAAAAVMVYKNAGDRRRRMAAIAAASARPRPRRLTDAELASADEPFRKVGGQFKLGEFRWVGPIVAGPDAIYLIKVARESAAGGGGVVGTLAVAAIERAFREPEDYATCTVGDLPPAVTAHRTWPARKVSPDTPVVVVWRDEIDCLYHPAWSDHLTFSTEDVDFLIRYRPFTGGKVLRHFERYQWPLHWRGSVQR